MRAFRFITTDSKIIPIDENIFLVAGKNRSRSPFSNSFLLAGSPTILLDTGCGIDVIKSLLDEIRIDITILSHSHPDHTAGSWFLKEQGAQIIVPHENSDSIGSKHRLSIRLIGKALSEEWISMYLPATGYKDFKPDSTYHDGCIFRSGPVNLHAIHTPGHTNDHYCLWEPDKKIMFGFDIDLSPFGPWYGNEESNLELFMDSINKIKDMPFETYISSHARPMKRHHAIKRLEAYGAVISRRDMTVLNLFNKEKIYDLCDITFKSPIYNHDYNKEMDRVLFYGESMIISKHLSRLAREGKINKSPETHQLNG